MSAQALFSMGRSCQASIPPGTVWTEVILVWHHQLIPYRLFRYTWFSDFKIWIVKYWMWEFKYSDFEIRKSGVTKQSIWHQLMMSDQYYLCSESSRRNWCLTRPSHTKWCLSWHTRNRPEIPRLRSQSTYVQIRKLHKGGILRFLLHSLETRMNAWKSIHKQLWTNKSSYIGKLGHTEVLTCAHILTRVWT